MGGKKRVSASEIKEKTDYLEKKRSRTSLGKKGEVFEIGGGDSYGGGPNSTGG